MCSLSLCARLYRFRKGCGVINSSCSVCSRFGKFFAVGDGRLLPGTWATVGVASPVDGPPPSEQEEKRSNIKDSSTRYLTPPASGTLCCCLSYFMLLLLNLFEPIAHATLGQDVFGACGARLDLLTHVGDVEARAVGLVTAF